MNEEGHPPTLRAAQPGNRNAVQGGVYSARVRAARADEIRAAATGISTLALARAAVRDEVPRLERVREALDEDFAALGPSTRAGAPRGQVSQRSSVSRQLAKLKLTWAMGEPVDGDDNVDCGSLDGSSSLREDLLASLARCDLLDDDLERRGVSTPRGGERRQVALRVQASRDLVRLADRIRKEARRAARSGVAPMSAWDVARDIAFDASQPPSDVLAAVKHLLNHRPPPLIEEQDDEPMSDEEIEAITRELIARVRERKARGEIEPEATADTADQPPVDARQTEMTVRCLEVLQRIGDGCDPRASARDRMHAAELRDHYVVPANADPPWMQETMEEWDSWRLRNGATESSWISSASTTTACSSDFDGYHERASTDCRSVSTRRLLGAYEDWIEDDPRTGPGRSSDGPATTCVSAHSGVTTLE